MYAKQFVPGEPAIYLVKDYPVLVSGLGGWRRVFREME